jgi:hypothetical protein
MGRGVNSFSLLSPNGERRVGEERGGFLPQEREGLGIREVFKQKERERHWLLPMP